MVADEERDERGGQNQAHQILHKLFLVFEGPVDWTEKKTETRLIATDCNQTIGCGCRRSMILRLPVSRDISIWKNR